MFFNICKFLFPVVLLLFSIGCETDRSIDSIHGNWEVIGLYNYSNIIQENMNNSYVLNFLNDSIVNLNLDLNTCSTNFKEINGIEINFKTFGCTYMCCDNNFSLELKKVLEKSKRYEIKDNILSISGMGEVILRRIE